MIEPNKRPPVITRRAAIAVALALVFLSWSCGRKHHRVAKVPPAPAKQQRAGSRAPQSAPPPAVRTGYTEVGIASWYGIPYHGRPAANGEIYDMETLVAAHRVLPFNTWLLVTNLTNDKSVKVRVIDRGPFVDGRILDLSKAAARQIGLLGPGFGKVRLEVVSAPADIPSNDFYAVQIGAFSIQANAERARSRYAQKFGAAYVALKQGKNPMWRVLVGKESSLPAAQELAKVLSSEHKDVFVVRLDESITRGNQLNAPAAEAHDTLQP